MWRGGGGLQQKVDIFVDQRKRDFIVGSREKRSSHGADLWKKRMDSKQKSIVFTSLNNALPWKPNQ